MNELDEKALNDLKLKIIHTESTLHNILPVYNVVKRKKLSLEMELKALKDELAKLESGQIDFISTLEF